MTICYRKHDNYYFDLYISCIKIQLQASCESGFDSYVFILWIFGYTRDFITKARDNENTKDKKNFVLSPPEADVFVINSFCPGLSELLSAQTIMNKTGGNNGQGTIDPQKDRHLV